MIFIFSGVVIQDNHRELRTLAYIMIWISYLYICAPCAMNVLLFREREYLRCSQRLDPPLIYAFSMSTIDFVRTITQSVLCIHPLLSPQYHCLTPSPSNRCDHPFYRASLIGASWLAVLIQQLNLYSGRSH